MGQNVSKRINRNAFAVGLWFLVDMLFIKWLNPLIYRPFNVMLRLSCYRTVWSKIFKQNQIFYGVFMGHAISKCLEMTFERLEKYFQILSPSCDIRDKWYGVTQQCSCYTYLLFQHLMYHSLISWKEISKWGGRWMRVFVVLWRSVSGPSTPGD